MKLFNLLNDNYISNREQGFDCDTAFVLAYSEMLGHAIEHFSPELQEEYIELKQACDKSHKVTQQLELNYKLQSEGVAI